jgi:hypothetical protein
MAIQAGKATNRFVLKQTDAQEEWLNNVTALLGKKNPSATARTAFVLLGQHIGLPFPEEMEQPGGLRNPKLKPSSTNHPKSEVR